MTRTFGTIGQDADGQLSIQMDFGKLEQFVNDDKYIPVTNRSTNERESFITYAIGKEDTIVGLMLSSTDRIRLIWPLDARSKPTLGFDTLKKHQTC